MQLFLALVVPVVLLVGLTALLATGRLALSRNAAWLLARQNTIWMAGIVALAAAAVVMCREGVQCTRASRQRQCIMRSSTNAV